VPPPSGAIRRLLLVRPDHVGDVLLTSPAVDQLRRALPAVHVTYLVGPWAAEVARHGPGPATLASLDFPAFTRRTKRSLLAPYALLWREAARLRLAHYDAAVVFRPDDWWGALLVLAAGIPVRLGIRVPETEPLLTHALPPAAAGEHAAALALRLADLACQTLSGAQPSRPPDGPIFRLTAAERGAADRLLAPLDLGARGVVAVQPSAGAPLKSWPVERWAAVADDLAGSGAAVLLVGGPGDASLLLAIAAAMRAAPTALLSGQPLGVTAAVFARCALVVGLDGGAAHVAAAVGTPTVRLYGPADPRQFGPWPPAASQRLLVADGLACVPCGCLERPPCGATTLPACLLAHDPRTVALAARRALSQRGAAST